MDVDTLFCQGIYKNGYGIVPQSVMRDKSISVGAKALYAYICSFAGKGTTAFPSLELICSELSVSVKTMYKFRKELESKNLLEITKERKGKKYSNNIYRIIINPETYNLEHSKIEHGKFERGKNDYVEESESTSQFVEPSKFEHVQVEQVQKVQANNNSINNNIYSANKEIIEEIWSMYPNKKGKSRSLEYISKILKKISVDELKRCVLRYSKEVKGKEKQFILNGSTFFCNRYMDYLDSEYEEYIEEDEPYKPRKPKFKVKLEEDM